MIRRILEKLRRGDRRDLVRERRIQAEADIAHRRAEIHESEHRSSADRDTPR